MAWSSRPRVGRSIVLFALIMATLVFAGSRPASATGTGPAISIGSAVGGQIPVSAGTTVANAYKGHNVHVHVAAGGTAALTDISGAVTGSVYSSFSKAPFCTKGTPTGMPNDRILACTLLGSDSTSAGGVLQTLTFTATGNGCLDVSLVTDSGGSPTLNTFTINAADNTQQANTVDTTTVRQLLVGTGTAADCPSSTGGGGTGGGGGFIPGGGGNTFAVPGTTGGGSGSGGTESGGGSAPASGGGAAGGGGSSGGGGSAPVTGGGGGTTSAPINRAEAPIPPKTGDAGLIGASSAP